MKRTRSKKSCDTVPLNKNLLAGRDKEPNLSSSAAPADRPCTRPSALAQWKPLFSLEDPTLESRCALGLDVYQITKTGWKLTKENVDKLIPEVLGSVPPDTPFVLLFLDNSSFMGLSEEGSISQPVS